MTQQSPEAKPTVVLVHGAFAKSSSWSGVIAGLLDSGYPVLAVANPLRGVRTDAAYVDSALDGVDGDIVLAAHSYGGMVTSNTSNTSNSRVRALVFVGAFAGDSAATLSARFPGSTLADTPRSVPLPGGDTDRYIWTDRCHAQFAADSSAADAAVMAATQRPITQSGLEEPSIGAAWRKLPSWFLFGAEDRNIPAVVHRFMTERAGSRRTVELAGGSHTVAIPEAATVVELIEEAAAATMPAMR